MQIGEYMDPISQNPNYKKLSTKSLVLIAMFAAITCVLAPFSIPLPMSPVPISLTVFILFFSIYILGTKHAFISYVIYLLIGLVGLPVFSGFSGGPGKLFGPTGGYLIGFGFMILISGFFIDRFSNTWWICFLGMCLGTIVCYIFGTIWLSWQANLGFNAALSAGVIPFIPADLFKILIVLLLAPPIKKQLQKIAN